MNMNELGGLIENFFLGDVTYDKNHPAACHIVLRAEYLIDNLLKKVTKEAEFPDITFVSIPEREEFYEKIKREFPGCEISAEDYRRFMNCNDIYEPFSPVVLVDRAVSSPGLLRKLKGTNRYWNTPRNVIEIDENPNFEEIKRRIRKTLVAIDIKGNGDLNGFESLAKNWDASRNNGILVLSGATGVGKTTIAKKYCRAYGNAVMPVKFTSRKPRKDEVDGKDYRFVTRKDIERLGREGEVIEYKYNGALYGIPLRDFSALDEGKDLVLVLNIHGLDALEKHCLESRLPHFIFPVALWRFSENIRKSLLKRGSLERAAVLDDEEEWYVNNYKRFMTHFFSFYYIPGVFVTRSEEKGIRIRLTNRHWHDL